MHIIIRLKKLVILTITMNEHSDLDVYVFKKMFQKRILFLLLFYQTYMVNVFQFIQ